jgi:hypothetical protein
MTPESGQTDAEDVVPRYFIEAFTAIAQRAHANARAKGFWEARDKLVEVAKAHSPELGSFAVKAITGLAISLTHSELSEALEGERKDLKDDKIPEFDAITAEYADTIIRLMDHSVERGLPLAEAIIAKMAMNSTRSRLHGGKAF